MITNTNLLAATSRYWFKQKTLYSDFDLLLSRFSTLQIFYTIAFVLFGSIFFYLWLQEHKKSRSKKWFTFAMNRTNMYLTCLLGFILLIIGTWLGR